MNKKKLVSRCINSWLDNYIKADSYSDVKDTVLKIEGIKLQELSEK